MSRKVRAASWLLVAFAALLLGQGCSTECNDCGECGMTGGPNERDALQGPGFGLDAAGTPTVELVRIEEGECDSAGSRSYWITFDADGAAVLEKPEDAQLDEGETEISQTGRGSTSYEIASAGAVLTIQRTEEGQSMDLTLSRDGVTVTVTCSLSGEQAIACGAPA